MRKRLVTLSAQKLRKEFQEFDSYALQEKFRSNNTSLIVHSQTSINKSSEMKPRKISLIASVKKIDSVTPTVKKSKSILQSSSVSRLYNNEYHKSFHPSQTRKTLAIINPSNPPSYSDREDFDHFRNSLIQCKSLQADLELNHDTCKNFQGSSSLCPGLYLQIEDELKKHSTVSHFKVNPSYLLQSLLTLTQLLRELLRALKSKKCDDEAEVLEVLWRANVKVFDAALVAHEARTVQVLDQMRENTRTTLERIRAETEKALVDSERQREKIQNRLEECQIKFKSLRKEYRVLEEKLNQKEGIMQELAEIDKFDILKNTKKTLDDLTETLTRVTDERKFQVKLVSKLT
jgi:hypothetical protein